jgi:hypothetical protein
MRYLLIVIVILAVLAISGCEEFKEVPEKELPSIVVYENISYEASGEYYQHELEGAPAYAGKYEGAYLFIYEDDELEIFVSEKRFPTYYRIYKVKLECVTEEDCVPAECCHASECVPVYKAPDCEGIFCTAECMPGTMDCGQGHCICETGVCTAEFN